MISQTKENSVNRCDSQCLDHSVPAVFLTESSLISFIYLKRYGDFCSWGFNCLISKE